MSLQDRWDGLSPTLRRGLVLGGAVAVLLAVAALLVSAPEDERAGRGDERRRLITNLLTDADPVPSLPAMEARSARRVVPDRRRRERIAAVA